MVSSLLYSLMYKILPHIQDGDKYIFSPVFGFTYSVGCTKVESEEEHNVPNDLKYVKNPFLLHNRAMKQCPRITVFVELYARMLVWCWRHCYPLIYMMSHLRLSIFETAGDANLAFRKILTGRKQSVLCLPRSIFIATTSKRFKEHGTMFIGCFFPSRHMHAWVVEDGMHSDVFDTQWIMFTPLVMMK